MSATWAVCPACGALVADTQTHADWHAAISLTGDPTGTPEPATGMQWPTGETVTVPPPPPTTEEIEILRRIISDGRAYLGRIPQGQAIIDAYLALPAPTTAQTIAHVRALTQIQRGVLNAVRDLIRATMWRAKEK